MSGEASTVIPARPDGQSNPLAAQAYDTSRIVTFTIDAKKFDTAQVNAAIEKIDAATTSEAREEAVKAAKALLAAEVRKQMEAAHPGITQNMAAEELAGIGKTALDNRGPLSYQIVQNNGIQSCVIFEDNADGTNAKTKLAPFLAAVEPQKLKPLPGSEELWAKAVGAHEGQHCNQNVSSYDKDKLKTANLEGDADNAALAIFNKESPEAAKAFMDLRIIGAVNLLVAHDNVKYSSALFSDGKTMPKLSDGDLQKLDDFKAAILTSVSLKLAEAKPGATTEDVKELLRKEPEKFNAILQHVVSEGKFGKALTGDALNAVVAKEAGMTPQEFNKLYETNPEEYDKKYKEAYAKVTAEGKNIVPDPALQNMATQYLQASDRRIETPAPAPAAAAVHSRSIDATEPAAAAAQARSMPPEVAQAMAAMSSATTQAPTATEPTARGLSVSAAEPSAPVAPEVKPNTADEAVSSAPAAPEVKVASLAPAVSVDEFRKTLDNMTPAELMALRDKLKSGANAPDTSAAPVTAATLTDVKPNPLSDMTLGGPNSPPPPGVAAATAPVQPAAPSAAVLDAVAATLPEAKPNPLAGITLGGPDSPPPPSVATAAAPVQPAAPSAAVLDAVAAALTDVKPNPLASMTFGGPDSPPRPAGAANAPLTAGFDQGFTTNTPLPLTPAQLAELNAFNAAQPALAEPPPPPLDTLPKIEQKHFSACIAGAYVTLAEKGIDQGQLNQCMAAGGRNETASDFRNILASLDGFIKTPSIGAVLNGVGETIQNYLQTTDLQLAEAQRELGLSPNKIAPVIGTPVPAAEIRVATNAPSANDPSMDGSNPYLIKNSPSMGLRA